MRVDLLWALDALLTGSVLFLSGFALRHHVTLSRMRQEVQTAQRELENRLGTIQQQTGFDTLPGGHNPQMFQAKLSTLLREKESLDAIRLAVRRRAALDNLFRRGSAADEFFLIAERARITIGIQLAEQLLSALRAVGLSASFGVMFRILFPVKDSDSQTDSDPIPSPPSDSRFALLIVCIVIAIERFCFHVLFSLYTLFQMAELGQTEAQATLQFGVFTSIMYFTPVVGGPVADRAGRWPGILVGIALLALGYLAFGFGLPVSVSLSFLAFGMGLFKGNITTIVGTLVPKHERDAAYSRFYWAVNLGALPSGFVAGWLCASYGFRFVFLFCCAGMALLLPIGILCRDSFREAISVEESAHHNTSDRERIITILTLLPIAMLFFCAFYQSGTSLTLFAKNSTREALAGFPISPPAYQSLQPALVLILSPVLVRLFRCWPLRTWHKLLIGMGLCLLSCLVMVFASLASAKSDPQRVSPLWLIGSYFLISIGELCFSPIGFSLVSKLSPSKYAGLLMGLWMAAIALGNLGTGFLGILWERWSHPSFFLFLTGLSALAIPLLWSQRHRLDRVLGGRHD